MKIASQAETAAGPGYAFRVPSAEDRRELVALFARAYPDRRGTCTESHWRWKYERNPLGTHSLVATNGAGRIVGHVGGLPQRTWCRGETRTSVQAVDHMVDPEARRGLARISLFARLKRSWVEAYCGRHRAFFGYGFPSAEDFRIGERFVRYAHVRPVWVLVTRDLDRFPAPAGAVTAATSRTLPDGIGPLWARVREELVLAVVRDRDYLAWRYLEHPDVRYEFVAALRGGQLAGLAVVRRGGLADDVLLIADWLAPQADRDVRFALLCEVSAHARRLGLGAVACWFPAGISEFDGFQRLGFRVRYTPIVMAGRIWDPAVEMEEVRRSFYMTLGDIDYL